MGLKIMVKILFELIVEAELISLTQFALVSMVLLRSPLNYHQEITVRERANQKQTSAAENHAAFPFSISLTLTSV
jgi:hypothetical protein